MTGTVQPTTCDPGEAKAKKKLHADITELKHVIETADVVDVGVDTEYVPDAPRLRAKHPNYDGADDNE